MDGMTEKIRWGILSTGNIARQFARGLQAVEDAELVAVGSRNQASADAFGDEFGVPNRYDSYEALARSDIDAVYIGTPHPYHKENALLCLEAGKAVLCEKPFAMNAAEAREMIETARGRGVFLMEAMWTRFIPVMVKIRELLAAGTLGEIRWMSADFAFWIEFDPEHRLFNPALGGGALLDVGIYPISFASMVMGGPPQKFTSAAHMGQTGVDEQSSYLFQYENGAVAQLSSGMNADTPQAAVIAGRKGRIEIQPPFYMSTSFKLVLMGEEPQTFQLPFLGNGYSHEAMEVGACLRAGALESDIMPLDETLQLMQTLDAIRAEWGMTYPGE